ncbi:MAG TPA: DNA replication and repair protein RecF [Patescibacteria group bacterium]|nr:DNA replication and repair protein RecF [Patescibacteria group bacterium]
MYLKQIILQHFRSYSNKHLVFSDAVTIVVGPNTAGKTNLIEAIVLLSSGKTFRSGGDSILTQDGQDIGRVQGLIEDDTTKLKREVTLVKGERFSKRYLLNGIVKSRSKFMGDLPFVLFHPGDLNMVIEGPAIRREFLDAILEQTNNAYALSRMQYDKALKQRNALLAKAKEKGRKVREEFRYWDDLLISHGSIITEKRGQLLSAFQKEEKQLFNFSVSYDPSIISEERLKQYEQAEIAAGITLVGPQRDDFILKLSDDKSLKDFGSRGQQRLVVLQMKLLQIQYMTERLQKRPLLLLDDIFSELDKEHIAAVLSHVTQGQVIITTTHEEFIPVSTREKAYVVQLTSV